MLVQSFQHCKRKRIAALVIIISFITSTLIHPAYAQLLNMPAPGTMVGVSPDYVPVLLKGLQVHPKNPLLLDFILDTGKSDLKVADKAFKDESQKLIKYFLTALTVKEENLWVNLSPLEQDRMIPEDLGQTEMGRDMLAQDYLLKQLTASLLYPEKELGQAFWDKVYAQAKQQFGSTDIPVDTFNKVWIVADKAKVLERDNAAYVVGSHLKVLLDADYAVLQKHTDVAANDNKAQALAAQVIRDIILPAIEKEVNEGQNFAALRQIFHSMILSTWYKLALKDALLNQVYSDQSMTSGVLSADLSAKEKIYEDYIQAYKKGVFDFIKDDVTENNTPLPRRYFSGGEMFADLPEILDRAQTASPAEKASLQTGDLAMASVQVHRATGQGEPTLARLDARAVDEQVRRMFSGKYPPLNVFLSPGKRIQAEIYKKVLLPLSQAVSAEILEIPSENMIHLTVADKNEDAFLQDTLAGGEVVQNFVTQVKEAAATVSAFKGRINGRIFLAPDGVVVWWIDDENFIDWVNNSLRQSFSGDYFSPKKIVAINLGRIKKSGMNEELLSNVEMYIKRVLAPFQEKGSFSPEADLKISSVTVAQRPTPGWKPGEREYPVPLKKAGTSQDVTTASGVSAAQSRLQAFLNSAKRIWEGIAGSVTAGITNSIDNKNAQAANKAGFDIPRGQDKPFFGVAALLEDEGYTKYFESVQDIIAEELGVKEELQRQRALKEAHRGKDVQEDAVLIRTSAAMFVPPGGEHITLASNVMTSWAEVEAVTQDLREDTRHMGPFSLQVDGPQMMRNLGITIKLITQNPEALIVKERSLARAQGRKVPSATMPPFFHSSVAYITNATDDQLARIDKRLQDMPGYNEDVTVRHLAVEMGSIGRKEVQQVGPVVDLSWETKENLPKVLDSSKVNAQVEFMYTEGFSPLHVMARPGAELQKEIEPLLRDLRAAVPADVLDVPAAAKLHWNGVDKWASDSRIPQEQPVSPADFTSFIEEVKWSAQWVSAFKGTVRGRLYLSDNGVVVWWMESEEFNMWMKNSLRGVFSDRFKANTVVTMSLGRIKKAGLSEEELAALETKINAVLAQYMVEGEYAPKEELTVDSVFAGQGAMTAWDKGVYEEKISLATITQSDDAMQVDMAKIFATLKDALTGQEALAGYAQEFIDGALLNQTDITDSELEVRWTIRQLLRIYGRQRNWPVGFMKAVERRIAIVRSSENGSWVLSFSNQSQDFEWIEDALIEKGLPDWNEYQEQNGVPGDFKMMALVLKHALLSLMQKKPASSGSPDAAMLRSMREKIILLQNVTKEQIEMFLDQNEISGDVRTLVLEILLTIRERSVEENNESVYQGIVTQGWTKDEFDNIVAGLEKMLNDAVRSQEIIITEASKMGFYTNKILDNLLLTATLFASFYLAFKLNDSKITDPIVITEGILVMTLLWLNIPRMLKMLSVGKDQPVLLQEQMDIARQFVKAKGNNLLTSVKSREDAQKLLKAALGDWLDSTQGFRGNDIVVMQEAVLRLLNIVHVSEGEYNIELRLIDNPDAAMNTDIKGGIDLQASGMDLDITKDGAGVVTAFDPVMAADFRKGNFTGVEGIILRIVPLAGLALN